MTDTAEQRGAGQAVPRQAIREALDLLGIERLVLAIHDASFPAVPGEDVGRGSPYTTGGRAFLRFVHGLGFDGIQLGPQGPSSRDNPSPYDSGLFSRNPLNIDLHALARDPGWRGLLSVPTLARIVAENPCPDGRRAQHAYLFDAMDGALREVQRRFADRPDAGMAARLEGFRDRGRGWLRADALYDALARSRGGVHHRHWPAEGAVGLAQVSRLEREHAPAIERYALAQWICHEQHQALRRDAAAWGLRLYGDLQIGLSPSDQWSRGGYYLADYLMGAPPSRTNPAGQPWGYGVLDPRQYHAADGSPGPALRYFNDRVARMLEEYDGLRIDHPHGLVCPWVYRADDPDPAHAVRQGARLFSSPRLPDHPGLAAYAIVSPEQLNPDPATPRHADDWVRDLDTHQEARYAILLDALATAARDRAGGAAEVLCEVLSTQPYPLARVIARHGLGRFRVTQKADLGNPADVYRGENAHPEDWIMVGNHDTPPVWRLARQWMGGELARRQAEYLAGRLVPAGGREAFSARLASDRRRLVHAKLADLFVGPARQVMVFFADLLGLEEVYNTPGVTSEENWTLRVPPDYATSYVATAACGEALDLPLALALALRARGAACVATHGDLIARLDARSDWWRAG